MREKLTALNRTSADEYAKYAADYVRATRLARDLRTDLNEITRRIT